MEKQKSYKSWTITDELWNKVKELIPTHKRDKNRTYKRKAGGGRKPPDYRKILEGIFYVLRTGCQWKAMPAEFGKGSNIHRYFQLWEQAGFFKVIWTYALEEYDDLKGIEWEWKSLDGGMTKAPLALESVGRNPTDRGEKRHKTQLADRREGHSDSDSDIGSKHA
jgi:transposase